MPEGPEVFIIATVLDSKCRNKKILNISTHPDSRYTKKEKIDTPPYVNYIPDKRFDPCIGKTIKGVQSKGKKIIFILNNDSYLLSSLAMEGRWTLEDTFPTDTSHLSVSIELPNEYLLFRDSRHFGDLTYCKSLSDLNASLKSVGPSWIPSEMFNQKVTLDYFTNVLQGNSRIKNKPIMIFLMDQKFTSGIGNYIRAEALYKARINPNRTIGSLTSQEIKNLFVAIKEVMKDALKSGGHTLKSYFTPIGNKGGYVPIVYGRTKTLDTNMPVIREFDSQKRTIHWVPSLQN